MLCPPRPPAAHAYTPRRACHMAFKRNLCLRPRFSYTHSPHTTYNVHAPFPSLHTAFMSGLPSRQSPLRSRHIRHHLRPASRRATAEMPSALVRPLGHVDPARLPPTARRLNRLWPPGGVLPPYGSHLQQRCISSAALLLPPSPHRPQANRVRMTSTVRALSAIPSLAAALLTGSNVRAASTQQSSLRIPRL
ncbi:hypothetical protein B0H19DRAFT_1273560 [Mycena capillaripes]|nr:hypothetical protein B0H19DRAFT_1273560 [Mycena capillaripes]